MVFLAAGNAPVRPCVAQTMAAETSFAKGDKVLWRTVEGRGRLGFGIR